MDIKLPFQGAREGYDYRYPKALPLGSIKLPFQGAGCGQRLS